MMYRDAVREALDEEMERDDMVMMIGEDVGFIGGNFKTSVGLLSIIYLHCLMLVWQGWLCNPTGHMSTLRLAVAAIRGPY